MEAGKRKFTLTALADLCRVLGVPVTAMAGVPDDAPDDLRSRLAALGGTTESTAAAQPQLADNQQSDELVRQRLRGYGS